MTPAQAILEIRTSFPELEFIESKTQTSFYLAERGNSGRVVRIAHTGTRPLKRAASSLQARHFGHPDGPEFEMALPATPDQMHTVVEAEFKVALSVAPTNWEKAVWALRSLGGTATLRQIGDRVQQKDPEFSDRDNVRKDLIMLTVNDTRRRAYRASNTRRQGRTEKYLDRIFLVGGEGDDVTYELYDIARHGKWVWRVTDNVLGLHREDPTPADLVDLPDFDPSESSTISPEKIAQQVAARRGQQKFRKQLLEAYQRKCCISGCALAELLEAAHIAPHKNSSTDVLGNGLLLRADLHTLFDLGQLRIHPETLLVEVHPHAQADSHYSSFHGHPIADAIGNGPSRLALKDHYEKNSDRWPEN